MLCDVSKNNGHEQNSVRQLNDRRSTSLSDEACHPDRADRQNRASDYGEAGPIGIPIPSRPPKPRDTECYDRIVRRRIIGIVSALAILLMALSPLYEFFDRWDNIPKTGNDTATTLVAIGACIGLWLISVLVVIELAIRLFALLICVSDEQPSVRKSPGFGMDHLQLLFSPPLTPFSLRI